MEYDGLGAGDYGLDSYGLGESLEGGLLDSGLGGEYALGGHNSFGGEGTYGEGLGYGEGLEGGLLDTGLGGLEGGEGLILERSLEGGLGGYADPSYGGALGGGFGNATSLVDGGYGYGYAQGVGYGNELSYGLGGAALGGGLAYGGLGHHGGLGVGIGLGAHGLGGGLGGGLGRDLLYEDMDFVDRELPLVEAWGGANDWGDEHYALADLVYYQRQLDENEALSQAERNRRWDMRLQFEEMADERRALLYRRMTQGQLASLGLYDGFWGTRLGGRRELSLDHLHRVPLTRGLFGAPYRHLFHRHRHLLGRYRPLLSRERLRPWRQGGGGGRFGGGLRPGLGLRGAELATRIRIAEQRAALTSLTQAQRSMAQRQAEQLQRQLSDERRLNQQLASSSAREEALARATEDAQRATDALVEEGEMARLEGRVRMGELAGRGLMDPRLAGLGGGRGLY